MEIQANAKLNLTLDVLGKRPDGYHDLKMIMQSITLADSLSIDRTGGSELVVIPLSSCLASSSLS